MSAEAHGELAVARIDRPPANALDPALLHDALLTLDELAADPPAAVVVTGSGGFFCAGIDLRAFPALDVAEQAALLGGVDRLLAGWYRFPRPVVMALNGHAVAGGLVFALCGDRRIASSDGKLGLTEVRAGIAYPPEAIAIVRAELSAAAARRVVLGSELVDPPEGLELGLVDEVVAPEDVMERALEVARELAALPGETYGVVKRQLRER